ncbi:MAG: hypothetical protein IJD21_07750 [Oscillospiraceae bacterium]|nr:hypothetical protein [Oscillospiraceae bacterium]
MRASDPGRLCPRDIALQALCAALLFALQVAMAALPNIELISLLIILFTLRFGRKALLAIYTFALLEGIWYGFHIWWIMYLYVWTILWALVTFFSRGDRQRGRLFWAGLSGLFGLVYGFLCSFPYLALGGIKMAYSWWLAGLPFDLIHGVSNFILTLTLFPPLDRVTKALISGASRF